MVSSSRSSSSFSLHAYEQAKIKLRKLKGRSTPNEVPQSEDKDQLSYREDPSESHSELDHRKNGLSGKNKGNFDNDACNFNIQGQEKEERNVYYI